MQTTILKNEAKDPENNNEETIKFAVTNRMSRATHGISITFNMTDPVPSKPNENAKDLVKSKLVTQEEYDAIHDLFQERPIWTLASIRAHMQCPPKRHLSFILATIAFYYSTGPWRNCFVRIGFDPRKNFDSRFYQMLDYRVRAGAGFKTDLKSRRQTGPNSKRVKVQVKYEDRVKQEIEEIHDMHQREAIFTQDTIPPFRARHYQFIDIHITEIQEMLQKIPSALSGAICNEKRGWLPVGFLEQCRDILTIIAQENMRKLCLEKNISVEEFKAEEEDNKSETLGADSDGEDVFPDVDETEMEVEDRELDE
jgi:general transcription factor 3C polypeptide 5 (transcription factor C subunit 1)